MSALALGDDGERGGYRPARPGFPCGLAHGRAGSLDEAARRLSHEELAVANAHVSEGHDVEALRERLGGGREADLKVCGKRVEVKSFQPADLRDGPPTAQGVVNKLLNASGQADHAVIYGVGSGLTKAEAVKGLHMYQSDRRRPPRLDHVRFVGDGFDLSYALTAYRKFEPPFKGRDRGPQLGL